MLAQAGLSRRGISQIKWHRQHRLPPLQSTQGWGTHFFGDGRKITSLRHPPSMTNTGGIVHAKVVEGGPPAL
jgi:hypothetical protein